MKIFLLSFLSAVLFIFYYNTAFNKSAGDVEDAKTIPVLIYHAVVKAPLEEREIEISLDQFKKQMSFLKKNNYKTLTLDEFYDFIQGNKVFPSRSVLLTFDDGIKTNYTNVYPVLKKYGFTAAAFIITNSLDQQTSDFFLNKDELEKIKDVFEYASHTHNMHGQTAAGTPDLLVKPKEDIIKDIKTSLKYVDKNYLAYPFGAYNKELIDILKELNIKMAFTAKGGKAHPKDPVYEIDRIFIDKHITDEQFMQILGYKQN